MIRTVPAWTAAGLLLCLSMAQLTSAQQAQAARTGEAEPDEPRLIVGVGAATSWNTDGGAAVFGPSLSAESTLVEHWLEVELGVSSFPGHGSTEWDTDFLAKKPWTLSRKAEFMLGAGPEWVHLSQSGRTSNSVSGEVVGDLMVWPTGHHHFGWFLEPVYDYSFAAGHLQTIGMSAGLLLGLARRHR